MAARSTVNMLLRRMLIAFIDKIAMLMLYRMALDVVWDEENTKALLHSVSQPDAQFNYVYTVPGYSVFGKIACCIVIRTLQVYIYNYICPNLALLRNSNTFLCPL